MKHSYILLLCVAGIATTQCSQNPTDQTIISQVTTAQQSIDAIIAQSNLDPIIADALTTEINNLTQEAQANMQQDMQEIKVAATLSTVLTSFQTMIKANPSLATYSPLISGLKHAAHANTIQKLLIGAYPGQFKDELYYTDPYTETIGFTLNDYCFSAFFTALVNAIAPTSLGTALSLTTTSSNKNILIARIAAGLVAHCAWLLQKQFIITPLKQAQAQQLQAQQAQNS